jgi:hypothetical protein
MNAAFILVLCACVFLTVLNVYAVNRLKELLWRLDRCVASHLQDHTNEAPRSPTYSTVQDASDELLLAERFDEASFKGFHGLGGPRPR